MRLGVWGWAALAALIVFGLAAWVLIRPQLAGPAGLSSSSVLEGDARAAAAPRVRFEPVATGFKDPVGLEFVPGHADQAVVLEKGGHARLLQLPEPPSSRGAAPKPVQPGPELLTVDVHTESELGLLGWAFHPHYLENGLFYVDDNPKEGALRTRISEWYLPVDALGKQPAQLKRVLLEINQPYPNHDGGQLVFGPDGYLYIAMGDGGSRADPQGNGQNLNALLGKILRIDVNGQPSYAIPSDNPFVHREGARPEIWAYGVRNPWRFTFDPKGRMIAADVGQDLYEEVDIVAAGDNQGWNVREATHCFAPPSGCPSAGFVDPIFEYGHDVGNSITGGHVYLGKTIPFLHDKYVFADYVTGRFWALELPEKREQHVNADFLGRFEHAFSAFQRDAAGEIYAVDFARGLILQLQAA
jgi:glucose/arabinose dehydrogenase